ncbi:hypothetical protein GOBAR_DD31530 [Gossypium barbadense]|nr:hypothetical protein GOBAR_DD31530 [Gossypium barbadense]
MKLLRWIRHKLRPSNIQPFKDFTIVIEFEAKGAEDNFEDDASTIILGLLHGFLTIGTVGSELIISELITSTFTMPLDNIAEEKSEVIENSLKIFNDELDKFFEAGA